MERGRTKGGKEGGRGAEGRAHTNPLPCGPNGFGQGPGCLGLFKQAEAHCKALSWGPLSRPTEAMIQEAWGELEKGALELGRHPSCYPL